VLNPARRDYQTYQHHRQRALERRRILYRKFLEVGKEPSAPESFEQLDEELIVDIVLFTVTVDAHLTTSGIVKDVLLSVNRRLDCNSKEMHCN
jgi:hypothetical protein